MSTRKPGGGRSGGSRRPGNKKPSTARSSAKKPAGSKKPTGSKKSAAKKPAARKKPAPRKQTPRAAAASRFDDDPISQPTRALHATAPAAAGTSLEPRADTQWSFREMAKRVNLRDRRTQIALGSISLVLVLIAVIAAWPGSSTDTSQLATDQEAVVDAAEEVAEEEGPEAAAEESAPSEAAPAEAAPQGGNAQPGGNPGADTEQAERVGAAIKPQSTSLPNGDPNTWMGVNKDTIKFAIAYDERACGVNTLTLASQAGANFSTSTRYYRAAPTTQETARAEFRQAADTLIKVINERAFDYTEPFPEIRKHMGDDPERPFYGRRIAHELVDGGSYQCRDTTTAAAVKIIEEIKPFVVVNDDGLSRAGYNMAAALAAKAPPPAQRPMHFGTLHESDSAYEKWAPYVWTQFVSGTAHVRQYASWLCTRVAGKNAVNSPDYKDTKRKFGLLYPNFQQVRQIANEMKGFFKEYCGNDIVAQEFAYSTDPSRAADQGTSIAVRFKVEGVTSVIYLLDLFSPLFHIIAMQGQGYHPELVFTGTNYMDSSTVQRLYEQPMVDKASFGITSLGVPGGFGYGAGDPFYAWHDAHQKSPKTGKACDPSSDAGMNHDEEYCKAPGAIVTLYYSVLPLLGGIIFAGPDLNPTNVTNGLQSYPRTRYGGSGPTTDPRPAMVGAGKGQHYFIVDAIEWRWRAAFVSPAPESKLGWVEWPDCQRHYLLWPDKLSDGWEKGGPNYDAWCGNAKYAPQPYKPADYTGEDCSDTPSGKCENDNYPPHPPEGERP